MAINKSLTVNFFGRDVTLNKTLDGIKKNTFATSNVLEQGSKKATYVLAALTGAALKFAKAAADDEKGAVSLANTLKTVTNATTAQIAGVEKFISKAELFSTVADDKIRPAFDTLARATGSIGKAQSMTNLALEISAKTGADVTEVANAMAKAQRGQFKALVNLTKIQPIATKGTTTYSKSLKVVNGQLISVTSATGKTAKSTENLEHYLKRVGGAYKGSIAAQSGTAAFKMAQFQRAMDRTQETLGYMLLPYLKDFSDWLIKIEPWVTKHKDIIGKTAISLAAAAASIKLINGAYKILQGLNILITLGKIALGWAGIGTAATTAAAETKAASAVMNASAATASRGFLGGKFGIWGAIAAAIGIPAAISAGKNIKNNILPGIGQGIKNWGLSLAGVPSGSKPKMAVGGIVTRRTDAIIGESGPEAVIPLNRSGFGGITIINHIQGSVVTEKELSLKIRNDMAQLLRRKGINPAVLGV